MLYYFTLKFFSASSSDFPSAKESCKNKDTMKVEFHQCGKYSVSA